MKSNIISSFRINLKSLSWFFVGRSRNLIQASALITLMPFVFGSCSKDNQGSVVFWLTESTARTLQSNSISSFTVYVDNQIIGSYPTNIYSARIPDCGATGSVGITKDLGKSKNKFYTYKAISNFGDVLWDGSIELKSETCLNVELGE